MHPIKLQILAHPDKRRSADIQRLASTLRSHGLKVTAIGAASVAAEVSRDRFEKLFGMSPPEEQDAEFVSTDAAEATAGMEALPVPADCAELVRNISIPRRPLKM